MYTNTYVYIYEYIFKYKQIGGSKKASTSFISIEDVNSDLWQLEPIIDLLREGTYVYLCMYVCM
jgi:hypothetical protein